MFYLTILKKYTGSMYENKVRESDPTIMIVSQLRYTTDSDERGERKFSIAVDYVRSSRFSSAEGASLKIPLFGLEKVIHFIPLTLWLTFTKPKITTTYPPIILALIANCLLVYHYLPCYLSFICG